MGFPLRHTDNGELCTRNTERKKLAAVNHWKVLLISRGKWKCSSLNVILHRWISLLLSTRFSVVSFLPPPHCRAGRACKLSLIWQFSVSIPIGLPEQQLHCHVKFPYCGIGSVRCYLIAIDPVAPCGPKRRNRWLKPSTVHTALRGYQRRAVWLFRDTKKKGKTLEVKQAIEWTEVEWAVSWFSIDIWPQLMDCCWSRVEEEPPVLQLPLRKVSSLTRGLKAARSLWKAAIDVENNKQNLNVIVFQMRR